MEIYQTMVGLSVAVESESDLISGTLIAASEGVLLVEEGSGQRVAIPLERVHDVAVDPPAGGWPA